MKQVVASVRNKTQRPMPVKAYNSLFSIIKPKSTISFDGLIKKARSKSSLQDFGNLLFEEPLKKLLWSINNEAELHPFGVMISKIRLGGILSNLLRAQYHFKKYPEILETELDPLLIITGLQRTGTTYLHRLISSDQNTRAVHSWEALNPAPLVNKKNERDLRLKQAKQSEKGLQFLSKEFFAIHPVEHLAPEEEVLLLDTSFISTVAEATMDVPSFADWVEKTDHTDAYHQLKKMLQLLQWQDRRKRWVLKTPHHLEFLPFLFKVFPDAKLIQTHRLPEETIASFLSMIYHGRKIFSDSVTTKAVRDHWFRKTIRMVDQAMFFRESNSDIPVLDLYYKDIVAKDQLDIMSTIYEFAGWDWHDELKESFKTAQEKNTQHKYGIHKYDLADYNLSIEEVRKGYASYYDHYFSSIK